MRRRHFLLSAGVAAITITPIAAQAQPLPAIGYLTLRTPDGDSRMQAAFMRGELQTARQLAARAKTRFPVGSPGWVKADDLATYRPPGQAGQRN